METIAIVTLVVLATVAFIIVSEKRRRESFKKRFPPISDAEFVARCGLNTNPDVALRVRRIVADQLGVEYGSVYPSSRFVEDLGC